MDWPPKSPDLNPIENLWSQLKRKMSKRVTNDTTLDDLAVLLVEEWNGLDQNFIRRLIESMRRRCQATIDANGGHTKY